jgi:hypothetical protein
MNYNDIGTIHDTKPQANPLAERFNMFHSMSVTDRINMTTKTSKLEDISNIDKSNLYILQDLFLLMCLNK